MAVAAASGIALPQVAGANPATEDLASVCEVTPSLTPTTVTHAGVQGVVSGEVLTFTQTVALNGQTKVALTTPLAIDYEQVIQRFEMTAATTAFQALLTSSISDLTPNLGEW